ncbi:dTDP-4-dehydrorhamnose 3,5-epimerase [Pedobacter sp. SD-b]|uniref:dTDP-4-dehydrorhamnose 3,5-epimerase n=1 Tax=Pedobacter segetis TaxID=2793069 RepID=A0ABS1BJW5_9SPHI|nr:dTDP-4-dehydrorhamnose 3,5-epimerase [Pedobacter segetis]MBK0383179.1 dTDP-4-dehydrorhamnose 3,5-epimerase [Pedobacter segetis]
MNIIQTPIKDLLIIEPKIWKDDRGYFFESYNKKAFADAGIVADFVQDNQSFSHKGALRGLHAQANPYAQGKLVRVVQGKVMDVAVDIRKSSATFGQHFTIELSGENNTMFWVPPGFLHGFVTLENNTIFSYKCTSLYQKDAEVGVIWNDKDLAINWGIDEKDALVSPKDAILPNFATIESPF